MTQSLIVRQNPDIKYLGKLLGDVIRSYGGEELYRRTEYIRSTSVDRHRGVADADAIDPGLDALSLDETLAFVRGFMLFSLLANLAEDRQGVAAEKGATVIEAIELLASEGVDRQAILDLLDEALIAPVLTAHPTEVRRKSIIDHKSRIAELLLMKDAGETETPQGDMLDAAILRQIALLWQTRPLRRERLFVTDEVQISQSYMKDVFLPVLPRLYAKWEQILGARLPSFLKLNSWIGGDRDGNPFVDADAMEEALSRAAETVATTLQAVSTSPTGARCRVYMRGCRRRISNYVVMCPVAHPRFWPRPMTIRSSCEKSLSSWHTASNRPAKAFLQHRERWAA